MFRIVAIALAFLFAFEQAGIYVFTSFEIAFLKNTVESRSNHSKDKIATFTNLHLDKSVEFEHSREFRKDGKLYDILKVEKQNENYVFTCFEDSKEKSSENQLKNQTHQNKKNKKLLSKTITQVYFQRTLEINTLYTCISLLHFIFNNSPVEGFRFSTFQPPQL